MTMKDRTVLRDLARRYREVCDLPVQGQRRDLWRAHNSLKKTRPPIYVRAFAWQEMPQARCLCEDPFLRAHEKALRHQLFWHTLNDDSVFEPWLTLPAERKCKGWGVTVERRRSDDPRGSF
jgi:hypothetical protein